MRGLDAVKMTTAALLCAGFAGGCGGKADSGGAASADEAMAEALWGELQGYESWGRFDNQSATPVLSDDHSGNYVVSYYDEALLGWALSGAAPDGGIAVKEVYSAPDDTSPVALTVMQKAAGYDPAGGDWFWATYSMDGAVQSAGAVAMCSGCHSAAATDFVFGE